jgi:hypothetical protein
MVVASIWCFTAKYYADCRHAQCRASNGTQSSIETHARPTESHPSWSTATLDFAGIDHTLMLTFLICKMGTMASILQGFYKLIFINHIYRL